MPSPNVDLIYTGFMQHFLKHAYIIDVWSFFEKWKPLKTKSLVRLRDISAVIINTQIFSLENQFLYYTVAFQSDIDPHLFIPTDNNWSFLYAVLRSCCAPIWFRFKGPNFDGFLIYWFWFISWSVWISAVICSILFHHVMLVVINNYYNLFFFFKCWAGLLAY